MLVVMVVVNSSSDEELGSTRNGCDVGNGSDGDSPG